jgi:hypothetical protein
MKNFLKIILLAGVVLSSLNASIIEEMSDKIYNFNIHSILIDEYKNERHNDYEAMKKFFEIDDKKIEENLIENCTINSKDIFNNEVTLIIKLSNYEETEFLQNENLNGSIGFCFMSDENYSKYIKLMKIIKG